MSSVHEKTVVDIGSRLELFLDDWLIDAMHNLSLKLHSPVKREVALQFDAPWEGPSCTYVTVMKDDDRYRMYYRGSGLETGLGRDDGAVTCYAESKDGITWNRPSLGICKFKGSTDNNIILTRMEEGTESRLREHLTGNFMAFKDKNPAAPREERYKALAGGPVIGLSSPDGIHWKKIQEEPIIFPYGRGARSGDHISLAFWDTEQNQYVAYLRGWRVSRSEITQCDPSLRTPLHLRQIQRCTSPDFIHWTEPKFIDFGETPLEHLYTNATTPYFRAPHIYLAFPKRFVPQRKKVREHSSPGVSDAVFMSSRDGVHWDRRFMEAFIRPGLDQNNWTQRSNMPAWGVVPTGPDEISVYYVEHYCHPTCRLRRATLRTDGFVSVHANYYGGEFITRPIIFRGSRLIINYSTSAVGSVRVEIQNAEGKPIPGYMLEDSEDIYGDEIEHTVEWKEGSDLKRLADQPIRLKFVMKDADLYSIRL